MVFVVLIDEYSVAAHLRDSVEQEPYQAAFHMPPEMALQLPLMLGGVLLGL